MGFADTPSYPATQVSINHNSTFIMGLQSAPFAMNAHYIPSSNNQNVNLCYTVDMNNTLYYLNKSCNPSIINFAFNTANIKNFFIDKTNDYIKSATADNQGNIYFLIDALNSQGYLISFNIINGQHQVLNLGAYYQIMGNNFKALTSDNQGYLYLNGFYLGNRVILQSKDYGITWSNITSNLDDYAQEVIYGILYDNFAGELQTKITYENAFGQQTLLMHLTDNTSLWFLDQVKMPNNFYSPMINYSYTGFAYGGRYCEPLYCIFGYYTDQINPFTVTNANITSNMNFENNSFDNQNNMYFILSDGSMYYFKAPA